MIDLNLFVIKDAARPNLMQPWNDGEHTIATNGCILIVVPRIDDYDCNLIATDYRKVIPNYTPIGWWSMPDPQTWTSTQVPCGECLGTGSGKIACPKCEGSGVVECWHCNQEMDCAECEGKGKLGKSDEVCAECKGAKTFTQYANIATPCGVLGYQTLGPLATLTNLRLGVRDVAIHTDPIHFAADGCTGAVMKVRSDQDQAVHKMHAAFLAGAEVTQ